MTTDCSLNYKFKTWKFQAQNMGRTCCVQKLFLTFRTISVHNMFSPCSAKRRASDKDLHVINGQIEIFSILQQICIGWSQERKKNIFPVWRKKIILKSVNAQSNWFNSWQQPTPSCQHSFQTSNYSGRKKMLSYAVPLVIVSIAVVTALTKHTMVRIDFFRSILVLCTFIFLRIIDEINLVKMKEHRS